MYAFFRGTVDDIQADKAVVDVNGVGYEINMPESELITLDIGDIVKIYTYLAVREDDMSLCGFSTKEEMKMFELLTSVSKIGPKVGLSILSFAIAFTHINKKAIWKGLHIQLSPDS